MKIKILAAVFFSVIAGNSFAQSPVIKPLKIGDKMPDLVLNNVINYKSKSINLSDFKGKLLMLDFWATWCKWCIEEFPKDDSLQHKYGNKLQIVLVDCQKTKDDETKVQAFYEDRLKADKKFSLPSVYLDTTLMAMFPHYIIPHYVWVKDGVIIAFTDQEQVTWANIEMTLKGKTVPLKMKQDPTVSGPFPGKY